MQIHICFSGDPGFIFVEYEQITTTLKTKDTKIWYLQTTKKASVPKIPKIGTLVPKISRTRYQIDFFDTWEVPNFGIFRFECPQEIKIHLISMQL